MSESNVTLNDLHTESMEESQAGLVHYFQRNWRMIAIVVVLIVALIAAIRIGGAINRSRQENISTQIDSIWTTYQQAFAMGDLTSRNEILDSVITRCNDLLASYPSSPAALEALFMRGNAYLKKGEYDAAISAFEEYADDGDDLQVAKAWGAIGTAHENRLFDDPENADLRKQAMDAYVKAEKEGTLDDRLTLYAAQALLGQARLHELAGQNDAAVAIYERVIAERPQVEEPEESDEYVSADGREARQLRQAVKNQQMQQSTASIAQMRLQRLQDNTPAD